MKLIDIKHGQDFILKRTGERYTKLDVHFYNGKITPRFNVLPAKHKPIDNLVQPTLNRQCDVVKIN